MTLNEQVGAEIRKQRLARGMTLRFLASALEVSTPFLSDVERGRRGIRKHLPRIAQLFGLPENHFTSISGICPTCGGTGRETAKS